jgi:hypothetical protein
MIERIKTKKNYVEVKVLQQIPIELSFRRTKPMCRFLEIFRLLIDHRHLLDSHSLLVKV